MWFWWFMFFCNLLIPVILLVAGRMMWKNCPKQINGLVGYRTSRSMKNMDTWKFAHEHCGKLWWKIGWVILGLTILVQLPLIHSGEDVIGTAGAVICAVHCAILILSIFPTEMALKKTFTDEGEYR